MRIWIDCEFNEFKGDLISTALIDEHGREFYASVGCENPGAWVAEHVMPIIGIAPIALAELQARLAAWLSAYDSVQLVADWPEDISHFCQTFITGPGYRLDTPPLTMEVRRDLDAASKIPHNALEDVRAMRLVHLAMLKPSIGLTFGAALEALKAGKRVARAGWNGKGMWLVMVPGTPSVQLKPGTPYADALGLPSCEILPHIDMWTVNASGRRAMLPGWGASQTDMLAEDWLIVE